MDDKKYKCTDTGTYDLKNLSLLSVICMRLRFTDHYILEMKDSQ